MKTNFYISWEVKKTNGAKVYYTSKMFDTEGEALDLFNEKIQRANVTEANLFKANDYYEGDVLPFPEKSNRTPWGWRTFDCLRTFGRYGSREVKIWNK